MKLISENSKFEIGKILLFGIILTLSFSFVSSFVYEEAEDGKAYYIAESDVIVPSLNINNILTLNPTNKPLISKQGMIYLDKDTGFLKFYDGKVWKTISFIESEISSPIKQEIEEESKKEIEKETISIKQTESSENNVGNDSKITESSNEKETKEIDEKCEEICEDVCKTEKVCEEVCEDVEKCEEICSTDEEGSESCEDKCSTEEKCEDVCEDVEKCEEVCREDCGIPEQLFDIRMDLEDNKIENSNELTAVVTYESFGSVPTPVDLTFEIFDLEGNLIYSKVGDIIVSIEEVRRYYFPDLNLPAGEYEFVFTTLYNVDVKDEFRQKFITGKEKRFFEFIENVIDWFNKGSNKYYSIGVGVLIFALAGFIIIKKFFIRKKNKRKKK